MAQERQREPRDDTRHLIGSRRHAATEKEASAPRFKERFIPLLGSRLNDHIIAKICTFHPP